jgi:translation initiation factor 3 subunit B
VRGMTSIFPALAIMLSVYMRQTMGLLDKESMKVANVLDFSWSPTEPFLSLFVPAGGGDN